MIPDNKKKSISDLIRAHLDTADGRSKIAQVGAQFIRDRMLMGSMRISSMSDTEFKLWREWSKAKETPPWFGKTFEEYKNWSAAVEFIKDLKEET